MAEREKRDEKRDEQLIALIAAAIAVNATPEATAKRLAAQVGVSVAALTSVLRVAFSRPTAYAKPVRVAKATVEASGREATYRAAYVLAASRRVAAGSSTAERTRLLRAEQQHFNRHIHATRNRRDTATQVDKAAQRYGDTLGWYAKMDSRTSAECKKAHGKNFTVGDQPPIGYPGAVHPHCRCKAGKPHATRQTVYGIKPDRKAA